MKGDVEVRASAPTGSALTLPDTGPFEALEGADGILVEVTTPNVVSTAAQDKATVSQNRRLGRSVITEQMALGMSCDMAVREYSSIMDPNEPIPTREQADAILAGTYTASTTSATVMAPYGSVCKDIYIDGNLKSHGCDNSHLKRTDSTGTKWYSHSMKISSQYDSLWFALSSTYIKVRYASGGTGASWVDWDPIDEVPRDNCGTLTMQASCLGITVSNSSSACADRIGPRFESRGFGTQWSGLASDWRGAHGVGIVKKPSNSSSSRTVSTYMTWRIKG